MDKISRTRIFLEVARQQSFSKAADALGMTASAVSKQVMNLEDQLKTKLLHRTTRSIAFTEEGAVYADRAFRALEDLDEAEELIQDMKNKPIGLLKINAPKSFGEQYLAPMISAFACAHESLSLEVDFDDKMIDIAEEDYDVVIRIGNLSDSSLISRKLAPCPLLLCASPAYLDKNRMPREPEQLKNHDFIAYTSHGGVHEWRYEHNETKKHGQIALEGRMRANNGEMMLRACLDGLGMVVLPIFLVQDHIDKGNLIEVLPEYNTLPERNIYALYKRNRYLSSKIRLFIDHLSAECENFSWV